MVYTGAEGAVTGKEAPLRLVVSQQHPESSNVSKTIATLKVGRNEITIPSLSSLDVEHGGQLYVEYTGDNDAADWGVRVSGAQAVPVLDLYQVDDPAERLARTTAYVQALEAYVPALEDVYKRQVLPLLRLRAGRHGEPYAPLHHDHRGGVRRGARAAGRT